MPARLRDRFATEGSTLERYASVFDCVEINSSFYRAHRAEVYARWAASVPRDFRFSVKLPQAITHDLRLRRSAKPVGAFLAEVAGLGRKLGVVLVQLPGSFPWDARVASAFFRTLRERHDGAVVCEPRHATWFEPRATALLARMRIGRVGADPARCEGAGIAAPADGIAYYRWHGSPRIYWSPYGRDRLGGLAAEVTAPGRAGIASWCIFDNTASQAAAHDALELKSLLPRVTSASGTGTAASRGRAA